MGAKVIKKAACIYTFGVNEKKSFLIENLCRALELEYKVISNNDRYEKIGYITHYPGYFKGKEKIYGTPLQDKLEEQPEVMIFSAFSDDKLDEFLKAYKDAGIEPVGLKAVVTKYNENWTLDELIKELIRERAEILLRKGR